MFSAVKRRLWGDQAAQNYMKCSYAADGAELFCQWQTITKAKGHRLCFGKFTMGIWRGKKMEKINKNRRNRFP